MWYNSNLWFSYEFSSHSVVTMVKVLYIRHIKPHYFFWLMELVWWTCQVVRDTFPVSRTFIKKTCHHKWLCMKTFVTKDFLNGLICAYVSFTYFLANRQSIMYTSLSKKCKPTLGIPFITYTVFPCRMWLFNLKEKNKKHNLMIQSYILWNTTIHSYTKS